MPASTDEQRFLKRLGLRLRQIRESKGWTLEHAEERGAKNWRQLQRIEAGHNLTIISLRRLAKVYKMSLHDIFSELE